MYNFDSFLIYIYSNILFGLIIGVSVIPIMFFYNYRIPIPDSANYLSSSQAMHIMLVFPYYMIKYFVLLLIKGDPVKRGEDTPVDYTPEYYK